MIPDFGQDKFEMFSNLTKSLQNCMRSNRMEKALQVAEKRHQVLVSLLENAGLMSSERSEYAMKAMACVAKEQRMAKDNVSEKRSDFVSRINAFKAYGINNT